MNYWDGTTPATREEEAEFFRRLKRAESQGLWWVLCLAPDGRTECRTLVKRGGAGDRRDPASLRLPIFQIDELPVQQTSVA